jgi:hypothetical protein
MIDIPKLRSEIKELSLNLTKIKKKTRDPILNKASFNVWNCSDFRYGPSNKRFYFDGDKKRTELYNEYCKAIKDRDKYKVRVTKLCALMAFSRNRNHFSGSSTVGAWSKDRLLKWLKPEIEEFRME